MQAALGTQFTGLAPLLGKEAAIEHLLSLFLQLLKDEFADVRLNIISKLEQVNKGELYIYIYFANLLASIRILRRVY
jgi:serine/threonine-protein phosphatase 2A regulatory subunit A